MEKSKKIVLQTKEVTKEYKMGGVVVKALQGVSLSIHDGEFVAIIGPSGSGKSTLMHIIGCLDIPTSGEVLLDGHQVGKMNERSLAEIRNKKKMQELQAMQKSGKVPELCCACWANGKFLSYFKAD